LFFLTGHWERTARTESEETRGDREGDTYQGEEGFHPQAQVQDETEREIHTWEKKAFIHKLR
jgi:hypothetical protein